MPPHPATPRHTVTPRTLCFVLQGQEVLLMRRAPHRRLFPGKINGVGGHVEPGEDVRSAAAREIDEETGLAVTDLWLAGVLHLSGGPGQSEPDAAGQTPGVLLFIFLAQAAGRQVRPSEEGELLWAPLTAVDELDWVDGDPGLLRRALAARAAGQPFFAWGQPSAS